MRILNHLPSNNFHPTCAWQESENDPPEQLWEPIQALGPHCEMHGAAAAPL
jgi:hypothetical protein